jgi:2-haloalkanoic acid dehalogenase type II
MIPGPFESYTDVWRDCFRRAFDEMGLNGDPDAANELCLADFVNRPPFPETLEVIAKLRGQWPMAILSNADDSFLYPLLDRYRIGDAFETIVSSEEARGYKPHPLIFEVLLKRMNVEPGETLMVGDTLHEDVWGSHRAGMPSAWINRHDAPMNGRVTPTHELHSLKDLVTVLNG